MTRLVVIGAGGHGREVCDIVDAVNRAGSALELVGVVDERGDEQGLLIRRGITMLGGNEVLRSLDASYLIGVGSAEARRAVDELASAAGLEPTSLVHPTAVLGSEVSIGPGFIAFPYAVVTTNVAMGRHVHLNVGATVSHDCTLGDYVTLSPGSHVSGNVRLGDGVTLGVGAVARQGVTVGDGTLVGAGGVVVDDLPPGLTAVGVPARPIRR
ncbi:MAG: acetyltransferase [Actinomycetota bacterium]|nr:acetyltransferase [Actinomycetota bacterium]